MRISFGILLALLLPVFGATRCSSESRLLESYKDVVIHAKIPSTIIKGKTHAVTVTLKNRTGATEAVHYVRCFRKSGESEGSLPVGLEFTNLDTKSVTRTAEPSAIIFFKDAARNHNPTFEEGTPLYPGEQISGVVDITETIEGLPIGDYRVTAIIWLLPGNPRHSKSATDVQVVEN